MALKESGNCLEILLTKLKEVVGAVLPITALVLILHFTITPLEGAMLSKFVLGAAFVVIGLTIFLFGADVGVAPVGQLMGSSLAKSNSGKLVAVAGFFLGFLISIAEPDLHILAGQVESVTSGVITRWGVVISVSLGIGILIALGLLRMVYSRSLRSFFMVTYVVILVLGVFASSEFVAIAFDASGATTGAMSVPFLLALSLGVSSIKGSESEEDSFGLSGIASAGAIIGVLLVSLLSPRAALEGSLPTNGPLTTSILSAFARTIPTVSFDVFVALCPLIVLFLVFQKSSFHLNKKSFTKILKGLAYTYIGLVLFLTGVNVGFMKVGSVVGYNVASLNKWAAVLIGFVLGLVVVLAEPAVYVLNRQVEDVTSGSIRGKMIAMTLSIGVAIAVALSIVRIMVPGLQLWHFLLPGYVIGISLMYFVPNLFIGVAFDAGGVASGPMSATFILAFAHGVAEATPGADVLNDGFGVISMIAMAPVIALQLLGLAYKVKSSKGGVTSVDS